MDKCFGRKKYGNIFLLDLDCAMPKNTLWMWFNIPWLASALWGHHVTLVQPGRWESEGDGWQTAFSGKELTTYADPHFCFSLNFIKC